MLSWLFVPIYNYRLLHLPPNRSLSTGSVWVVGAGLACEHSQEKDSTVPQVSQVCRRTLHTFSLTPKPQRPG